MATKVASILTALKTQAGTTLGNTYQEIRFVHNVARNDGRTAKLGYGFIALGAEQNHQNNVFGAVTLDHSFQLILTDTLTRNSSNEEIEDKTDAMQNKADEFFRDIVNTQLGVAGVLNVDDKSISETEITDDNKLLVLRMTFIVMYRNNI
jgi:hypothetical protein